MPSQVHLIKYGGALLRENNYNNAINNRIDYLFNLDGTSEDYSLNLNNEAIINIPSPGDIFEMNVNINDNQSFTTGTYHDTITIVVANTP